MQTLMEEPGASSLLLKAAVDSLGATAKHALPAGEWTDLFPWLKQAAQSPRAAQREHALSLLGTLICYLGKRLSCTCLAVRWSARQHFISMSRRHCTSDQG